MGHEKLLRLACRKYPALADAMLQRHEIYNRQLALCEKLEKEGRALIIRPQEPVRVGRTGADVDKILALHDEGLKEGREALSQDMGFVTPFNTFSGKYEADNPLIKAANQYIANGKKPVAWTFTTMPSEQWKDGVGSALLEYAQGTGDWAAVERAFVDGWSKEYKASNGG